MGGGAEKAYAMRVILTGATGFVGRHLLPALSPLHEVVCIARDPDALPAEHRAAAVRADLREPLRIDSLPATADAVIHLAQAHAAFPEGAAELFAVNAAAALQLADYARRAGAGVFVLGSSGNVYAQSGHAFAEDDPLGPSDYYGETKRCAEQLVLRYNKSFRVRVLRLFAPYGPSQTGRMIPNIIGRVRRGETVTLINGGAPRINPVYIDDLTSVIARVIESDAPEVLNVAGPDVVSVRDIASIAGSALGVEPVFEDIHQPDSFDFIADTARLRTTFPDMAWTTPRGGIALTARSNL